LFTRHELGEGPTIDVNDFLGALASYWTHVAALPPVDGALHLRGRQEQVATINC
jgi:hypothetical protein